MRDTSMLAAAARTRTGTIYALSAYSLWGLTPVYWKAIGPVGALEVICHRALWSTVFVVGLIVVTGNFRKLIAVVSDRRTFGALALSGTLVMSNWFVFIWAVQHDFVLESSLGYYINPLVSVLLAVLFLGDRLNGWRIAAVALATLAVLYLTWSLGVAPWLALFLAGTFGIYGLIRKLVPVDPLVGLAVETGVAAPFALAWMLYARDSGALVFMGGGPLWRDMLLVGSGLITAIPLVWFAAAAARLRLSSLGFFQYIAPTLNFLLAVFLYGEPFTHAHFVAFGLIWVALALVSYDAVRPRAVVTA